MGCGSNRWWEYHQIWQGLIKNSNVELSLTQYRDEHRNMGLEPSTLTEQSHHNIRIAIVVWGVGAERYSISACYLIGNCQQCSFLVFSPPSLVYTDDCTGENYCFVAALTLIFVVLKMSLVGCNNYGRLKLLGHYLSKRSQRQLKTNREEVIFPRKEWQVKVCVLIA